MLPVYRIKTAAAVATTLLLFGGHIILAVDARDCSKADVRLDEAWIDPDCDGLLEMGNDSLQGPDDAVKLAAALQAGTKVTRLHVLGPGPGPPGSANNDVVITSRGVAALAKVLPETPIVDFAVMSHGIEDLGAVALAEAIKDPRSALTSLSLRSNRVMCDGATALALALQAPGSTLERVDVMGNSIGDRGAVALAAAIAAESSILNYLHIQSNAMGDVGAMALAEAVSSPHSKMEKFYFRGMMDVSNDSKRAMEKAIATNRAALKKAAKAAATAGHEEL